MVKIVADTTSGLPREQIDSLGIPLIPQIVVFGEDSYRDDCELDTASFLKKLKSSTQLPKTAAPPPPLYFPIFDQAAKAGEDLVVVAPSAKVSGTVRSAEVAAQEYPKLNIQIVDTKTIAGNLASLVLMAHNWAAAGNDSRGDRKPVKCLDPTRPDVFPGGYPRIPPKRRPYWWGKSIIRRAAPGKTDPVRSRWTGGAIRTAKDKKKSCRTPGRDR